MAIIPSNELNDWIVGHHDYDFEYEWSDGSSFAIYKKPPDYTFLVLWDSQDNPIIWTDNIEFVKNRLLNHPSEEIPFDYSYCDYPDNPISDKEFEYLKKWFD